MKNPICIVANYLFDTLCHDIFQVHKPVAAGHHARGRGQRLTSQTHLNTSMRAVVQVDQGLLKEGLISVGSKRAEEPDPLDPEIIKRLANQFQYNK